MKARWVRPAVWVISALLVLAAVGTTVWAYVDDHRQYRHLLATADTVEHLEETGATTADVLANLGEPDSKHQWGDGWGWTYRMPDYRGYLMDEIILVIDPETSRVISVRYRIIN